ncbi:MAG: LysR substrate-binding domain-containing protein [Streptosporangiaceae bacterium]
MQRLGEQFLVVAEVGVGGVDERETELDRAPGDRDRCGSVQTGGRRSAAWHRTADHRGAVAGTVAIAAFATAARGLLPDVLRDLRTRYPNPSVSLYDREPHEAIPALSRGNLDVAVVQDWADEVLTVPEGLSRRDLLEDPFEVALPVDHPLADRTRVAITDLADDWTTWSTGQICHDWLLRTLRANDAQPRVLHTASKHSTQLALVAAGLRVAVIPRLGREPAPPSVRFVPIDPPPTRRVFALWRESATARPAITATIEALQRCGTRGWHGGRPRSYPRPVSYGR